MPETCLYNGIVVHRRLHPVEHELRYRVFNIFVDVDRLSDLDQRLRLFGYNRWNLFSISDRCHGRGDGTPIADHARNLARQAPGGERVARIFMFCYPRIFGHVFNPLTVYYGFDDRNCLQVMIYEVNNTFGERHSYVIPVGETAAQSCRKAFYVSPFNAVEGRYGFHFNSPEDAMALGVTLSIQDRPVLKAYVHGRRAPLTDKALLRAFASVPFLTFKVVGAIHWQALKLWWKGLRLMPRPRPPATHTVLPSPHEGVS